MRFVHFIDLGDMARYASAACAVLCSLILFTPVSAAEPGTAAPLHVAVYDVEPYGGRDRDGLFTGASVELWRRVAEDRHWQYDLTLVSRMDDVL